MAELTHPSYDQLRQVTPHAAVLLADNPGIFELEGTNTFLLRDDPARREAIVVDPGPEDWDHSHRILEEAGTIAAILITHRHGDHTDGLAKLLEKIDAPVYAMDPVWCRGTEPLKDGDAITGAGVTVTTLATPGHTTDSVCFLLGKPEAPEAVLTGDMILGRGTTVVSYPDGELGPYLESMERLQALGDIAVLPAHGPELPSIADVAAFYLEHRRGRLAQVQSARAELGLDKTAREIVERVYTDVPETAKRGAAMMTKAQLLYLDTLDGREPQTGRLAYASEAEVADEEQFRAQMQAKSAKTLEQKRATWAANEAARAAAGA